MGWRVGLELPADSDRSRAASVLVAMGSEVRCLALIQDIVT